MSLLELTNSVIKKFWLSIFLLTLFYNSTSGQNIDSTAVENDTIGDKDITTPLHYKLIEVDTNQVFFLLPKSSVLLKNMFSPYLTFEDLHKLQINVINDYQAQMQSGLNLNIQDMPIVRTEYDYATNSYKHVIPEVPIKLFSRDDNKPLANKDYIIPTSEELDVLQILWANGDVADTKIYSCLDTTVNMTMTDLNLLLKLMDEKRMISRKQISPKNEFTFAILPAEIGTIEMSPLNRKNKVYINHSNVDEERMKRFINACVYLLREDSSIVDQKQYKAVRDDSTLLRDLIIKINNHKGIQ